MKPKFIQGTYIVTFTFILFFALLTLVHPNPNLKIAGTPINDLNQDWFYESDEGLQPITLPVDIHTDVSQSVRIKTTLNETFDHVQWLRLRSSLQNMSLYLDGQLIYSIKLPDREPAFSAWHFVALPANASGKTLEIETVSEFSAMSGKFNPIAYGTRGDLILDLISLHAPSLILILLIFTAGLIMFLMPLLLKDYKKKETVYLGLFAITIALWFFAESKMVQFFTGSTLFLGSTAYLLIALFPLPLLLYVSEAVVKHTKKYYQILAILFACNLGLIAGLQYSGLVPFFISLRLTHLLIATAILMAVVTLFYEINRYHNKAAIHFVKAAALLFVFAGIEMLNFYLNNFTFTSDYTKIGLLLFIFIQSMDSISQMITFVKKSYVAEMYEQLAFVDQLTGGGNRMAFERQIEQLFIQPDQHMGTRLIIFDLNQLKSINDTWGHTSGDEAIQICFACIENAFSDTGKCYRIGGDEFAALLPDGTQTLFENHLERLNQFLKTASIQLPYDLGVAVGSVCFDPYLDDNIKVFMHRADMKMYENK